MVIKTHKNHDAYRHGFPPQPSGKGLLKLRQHDGVVLLVAPTRAALAAALVSHARVVRLVAHHLPLLLGDGKH